MIEIELKGLPKISLNEWYSGNHWSKRKQLKDNYHNLIHSQLKTNNFVYPKDKKYAVSYIFFFKSRPLDASNCVAMVKLIEDTLFEDDNYKIIPGISIQSLKGNYDSVFIKIRTL